MADIAVDPVFAQLTNPIPYASTSNAGAPPAESSHQQQANRSEAQPRLSHARPAVPEDPTIRPYGCNSPGCLPPQHEFDILRGQFDRDLVSWRAEHARLQANTSTMGQRPAWKHPSLRSVGICFAASRDLLDHLRDAHSMRQKGEVHVSQLQKDNEQIQHHHGMTTGELGEDGKMFRCALIGCQRTWKNANGLQYHTLTSLTAEEHNIDTVNRRRAPPKRKADGELDKDGDDNGIHFCPYKEQLNCKRSYKHRGGVRHHLQQHHREEPDFQEKLGSLPPAAIYNKKPKLTTRPATQADIIRPPPSGPYSVPPYSGLYTHGYVFSGNSLPFRPHNRPLDALYYLNVLCTAGIKTPQQRASERMLVNALLNANVVRDLQAKANGGGHALNLFDQHGLVKPPARASSTAKASTELVFSKQDVDCAIMKLASTLSEVGFGDALVDMEIT